jgi:hypothetical protein
MARVITKELAIKIRDKLQARSIATKNAVHDVYGVYHNAQLIAKFGIRRGSNKETGHDHVQKELNVSTNFAKQLGICTKQRDDYLRERHLLPQLPAAEEPAAEEIEPS